MFPSRWLRLTTLGAVPLLLLLLLAVIAGTPVAHAAAGPSRFGHTTTGTSGKPPAAPPPKARWQAPVRHALVKPAKRYGATGTSGKAAPPATKLGLYLTSEDGTGAYPSSWEGQSPDVAPTYLQWGQALDSTFVSTAESHGVTPMIEIEPWKAGSSWSTTPSFTNIASNGDSADNNCSLDLSSYSTNCQTWLKDLGTEIANGGKPVVLTFAHEFNVSGQYPWSQGDTGSCGASPCTPAQWIAAWDSVVATVNSTANNLAYWMWIPNTNTGGSTIDPSPYFPGASEVDMVGVDGYPTTQYTGLGTFSGDLGTVFSEIHALTSLPIFLAETNLAAMENGGGESISSFISDLCSNGGDGFLEFDDANWGLPSMTTAQWSEANTAMTNDCGGSVPPPAQPAPVVTTSAAGSVTTTGAVLNGSVNPEGAGTSYKFDYGTTTAYGTSTAVTSAAAGTTAVSESAPLTGLVAGTVYHYRIEATNSGGTSFGADQTFTTGSVPPSGSAPTVATAGVSATGATFTGTLNPQGLDTHYQFDYGTTTAYGSSTASTDAGSGSTALTESASVTGLTSATTYHYRIEAVNSAGTTYGSDQVLTTLASSPPPQTPVVTSSAAGSVTSTGATMNGSVNPEGAGTTYKFDYGTTTSYGSSTTAASAGSGTSAVNENAVLTGLSASTTYHYRIEAANSGGTSYSADQVFTTSAASGGPITHVGDSGTATGTGSTLTESYSSTAGHILVAYISGYRAGNNAVSASSVTDSAGNTWTVVGGVGAYDSDMGGYGYSAIAYTAAPASAVSNVTVHWSAAPDAGAYLSVSEFSGAPSGVTVAASATANTETSTSSYASPSVTVPTSGEALLSSIADGASAYTSVTPGTITEDGQGAWALLSGTGSQHITFQGASNTVMDASTVALQAS